MVSMEFKTMRMKCRPNFSEHRVDQVHDSIGGEHVKGDHASLPGGRLHGDVPAPGHVDLLAASGLHGGGALGNVAGLESSSRDNVAEENSCEGVLVSQQAVEGPSPARVSTRPAALTAAKSVESCGVAMASSAMFFVGAALALLRLW